MATTADYLNKLVTQKNTLADNLVTKGVSATHDETFETLIPKVLEISGGRVTTDWNLYHDPDPYNFKSNTKNATNYNGSGYNFADSIPNCFGIYQSYSSYNMTHSCAVDFTNVKKIIIHGTTKSNLSNLTATAYCCISPEVMSEMADDWTVLNQSVGCDVSEFTAEIDCTSITGENYIYFAIMHGIESGNNSVYLFIYDIKFNG